MSWKMESIGSHLDVIADDSEKHQTEYTMDNADETNEVNEYEHKKKHKHKRKKRKGAVEPISNELDVPDALQEYMQENGERSAHEFNMYHQSDKLPSLQTKTGNDRKCDDVQPNRDPLPSITLGTNSRDEMNYDHWRDNTTKANKNCFERIRSGLRHCWKVVTCRKPLFAKQDVPPRTLTNKQITKLVVLRFLMILHNIFTIWRVTVEKANSLYWILTLTVGLQVVETIYSLLVDRRIRKRWRPCFLVYIASVMPSFWILQYEQHYRVIDGDNTTCADQDTNGILDAFRSLKCMDSSTWFVVLLELFSYILLIGRLLHDALTQKVLIVQMIGFLASASDIMEVFSIFDEEKVLKNSTATIYVLVFWTFSFLQFIPILGSDNLGKTETKHRQMLKGQDSDGDDKKYYFPCCKTVYENFTGCFCCTDFNEDGGDDDTERNAVGLAFVFQDGPFLVLRLYVIFKFSLFTQSLIFFTLKNIALTIFLIVQYKWGFFIFFFATMFPTIVFLLIVQYVG